MQFSGRRVLTEFILLTLGSTLFLSGLSPAASDELKVPGCRSDRDYFARLQRTCKGKSDPLRCCVNDDGLCFFSCTASPDNDCIIVEALGKIHEFLRANKSREGYTPDPREELLQPFIERFRLLVCMQAQGYMNLYRCTGRREFLREAEDRLDFVLVSSDSAYSNSCFDGELGWAFLDAYELTCRTDYLQAGLQVAERMLTQRDAFLNWGLLAALNWIKAYQINGNEVFLLRARKVIEDTAVYQNFQGVFPHQARRLQRNLPYTSWLCLELQTYAEADQENHATFSCLQQAVPLLARQVTRDGSISYIYTEYRHYEIPDSHCVRCAMKGGNDCEPYCPPTCPSPPGTQDCLCITSPDNQCPKMDFVDTVRAALYEDEDRSFDPRGWTNELASTAFVLDRKGYLEEKWRALRFLLNLQNSDGSFPDKYAFPEKEGTPSWYWGKESHSVVRTSAVFFMLSCLLRQPEPRDVPQGSKKTGTIETKIRFVGSPLRGNGANVVLECSQDAPWSRLIVFDVGGRAIRTLYEGRLTSGFHTFGWDGTDDSGRSVAPGVYFAQAADGSWHSAKKLVILGQ